MVCASSFPNIYSRSRSTENQGNVVSPSFTAYLGTGGIYLPFQQTEVGWGRPDWHLWVTYGLFIWLTLQSTRLSNWITKITHWGRKQHRATPVEITGILSMILQKIIIFNIYGASDEHSKCFTYFQLRNNSPSTLLLNLLSKGKKILTSIVIFYQFTRITLVHGHIWFWRWQVRQRMEGKSAFPFI